jgi:hypothetical protein
MDILAVAIVLPNTGTILPKINRAYFFTSPTVFLQTVWSNQRASQVEKTKFLQLRTHWSFLISNDKN